MSISQRNYQRRASDLETVGSAPSSPDKRSKLHNSSTIHWLQRRHQNTANLNYLLLPEEIQTHLEVQDVFDLIDADKSGKLALHEFYDMLRQANIKIGKNDLKNFYRKVDDDCDTALDFKEFKNCTLSEEANLHFSKMMENVRKAYENDPIRLKAKLKTQKTMPKEKARDDKEPKEESKDPESDMPFLPRTFGTLLNYLAYLSKKKDMVDFINDKSNDYEKKFQKFGDLIDLQMDKDIYLEQYNSKLHRSPTLMSSGGFTARSQPESVRARRSISQDDKMDTKKLFPELSTAKANNFNNSIKEEQFLIKLDEMAQKTRQTVKSEFYKRRCRGAKLLSSGILSPPSEMEQISLSTHKESARVPWKNSSRITKGFQSAATSPHGANEEYEDGFPSPRRTVKKLSSGLLNNDFGSHGVPLGEDKESRLLDRRDYGINDSNLRITKDVFELRNDLQARLKPTDHVIEDEDEDKKGSLAGLRSLRKIMTSKMGDYQANCYSAASSPRVSIQQIQSYRETPQRNEFASSDVYSQQPAPVQTKSSKMPFNYDSVCPTFDYYCNSTNPNGIRSLRKRSKTKAIFVGVGTPSVKIQPESARGLPSYPLRNLSPKVEEPPLKKNGSHAKTVLNPLASFQENLAMKLQVALGKGVKRKTKLQLQGEKIQPASLDASIRRK